MCHYGIRILYSGLALIRVGDFDDMRGLIKISGGLAPFSGVEGEDRVDGHIRDRGGRASCGSRPTRGPLVLVSLFLGACASAR
jgi:hypothetical protein